MIKVTVAYNDHLVDIHFPCSEMTLYAALMEIHAADDNPPELFIHDVVFPEELDCLKDRFVNLDELNYLAKRMESFFGSEEEQFYEAMKQEGFTELKDVINLTFNLNKYCLIQNIGNMGKVGREYLLNRDGCIPANDDTNPKYAEIGRKLMQSGTGIVTEHGILFVDEDIPFEEPYDGQVFPPYIYDANVLCIAKAEYDEKTEYLYLPCERFAIDKAICRLGLSDADSVNFTLNDFTVDNKKWMRRLREMTESESIYDVNELVCAIGNADMQLDKLAAVAEYAGVEDAKSITALANSLGLFMFAENAEDNEDVGRRFVEYDSDYVVPETVVDFVDYDALGRHIAEELNGQFVSSGFVCMESGYSISDVFDTETELKIGGM